MASTKSPTCKLEESPNVAGAGVAPLTFTTAMSRLVSAPTSVARCVSPPASVTVNRRSPATTCAFVTNVPLAVEHDARSKTLVALDLYDLRRHGLHDLRELPLHSRELRIHTERRRGARRGGGAAAARDRAQRREAGQEEDDRAHGAMRPSERRHLAVMVIERGRLVVGLRRTLRPTSGGAAPATATQHGVASGRAPLPLASRWDND
jgi:hypothetical protein